MSVYDRIDENLPLDEQLFSGTETWFDFFLKKAVARASEILRFAEGATDAKIELSKET